MFVRDGFNGRLWGGATCIKPGISKFPSQTKKYLYEESLLCKGTRRGKYLSRPLPAYNTS